MALFKLTDQVWWGNMNAPVDHRGEYKSILDVSGIYNSDNNHYRLSQIDSTTAVFRVYANEDHPATPEFAMMLDGIAEAVRNGKLFPLLVHCFAGQCRAPVTACYMAWILSPDRTRRHADDLWARVLELGKDHGVDQRRLYSPSLRDIMHRCCRSDI